MASGLLGQLIRFGISGGIATAVYAIVYSPLAKYEITTPSVANLVGYFFAMITGYFLHSRWSFRGHGAREDHRLKVKFLLVQTSGFLLKEVFTWALTGPMHGATWWPLVPAIFVTPLATFALNRQLVFR